MIRNRIIAYKVDNITHSIYQEEVYGSLMLVKYINAERSKHKVLTSTEIKYEMDNWTKLILGHWVYNSEKGEKIEISDNHMDINSIFSVHLRDKRIEEIIR